MSDYHEMSTPERIAYLEARVMGDLDVYCKEIRQQTTGYKATYRYLRENSFLGKTRRKAISRTWGICGRPAKVRKQTTINARVRRIEETHALRKLRDEVSA